MRHGVVQRTSVLLSFHAPLVDELHTKRTLPWLHDDEAALLLRVDRRAWHTDALRATRLLATLLEELPVSCAVVGIDVARGFFASKPFQHAILRDRLVVDAFGDWLFPRAGAVAQIEQAIALARRRRPRRRPRHAGDIARAPGVEVVRVPVGTLAFLARARAELGVHAAHEAVAHGARIEAPAEPMHGALEHVLIVDAELSTCAEPLFALLSFARDGRTRTAVIDEARRLGADDDAAELVDDLVRDGLLLAHA